MFHNGQFCHHYPLVRKPLPQMRTIFVLIVLGCLASDLCDARGRNTKKNLHLRDERRRGGCDRRKRSVSGDDYQLGGLLSDPDLIKSLIPKNLGELFDLAEEIVPGMKALQAPIEKTWKLLHPILKVNLAFSIIIHPSPKKKHFFRIYLA